MSVFSFSRPALAGEFSKLSAHERVDIILGAYGWNNRVARHLVDGGLYQALKSLRSGDALTSAEWCALDAIHYGLNWYIQTGRASLELESELKSLTGLQYIKLVVAMHADGIDVSGNVGQWLHQYRGRLAKRAIAACR